LHGSDALATTALNPELIQVRALPEPIVGNHQQLLVPVLVVDHVRGDDAVTIRHADTDNAGGGTTHRANVLFGEADGLRLLGHEDDFVVATSHPDPGKFVVFIE